MTPEDIGRIVERSLFLSLDKIIGPRLVKFLYLLGLCAVGLWAVSHVFATFKFGFGEGLWGLLEVIIFGLLATVLLRIVCEALTIYFKANKLYMGDTPAQSSQASLIDEVRDAIEDLASEDASDLPAPVSAKQPVASPKPAAKKRPPSRTAKRSPTKTGPTNKTS